MENQQRNSSASTVRISRSRLGEMVVLALIIATLPRDAQAYIDPGSGALVVQAVLSGFFGFVFMARKALKQAFGRLLGNKDPQDNATRSHTGAND